MISSDEFQAFVRGLAADFEVQAREMKSRARFQADGVAAAEARGVARALAVVADSLRRALEHRRAA